MENKKTEFPILCETCLGDNPFLRMTIQECGQSCKICDRPFTLFRWRPGVKARFKKTQICKTCARLKNVCQTCILDLQFGLPVQVRDRALGETKTMKVPTLVVNRDFQFEMIEKQLEQKGVSTALGVGSGTNPYAQASASKFLSDLARKRPYYQRNKPHLCSFFERGECKRGVECPYRHEENTYPEELKVQKIKDRFYGVNDPVAQKILRNANGAVQSRDIEPPEDQSITSLFVGGVDQRINQINMRENFKKFGEITGINLMPFKGYGFINFQNRKDAEKAMEELKGNIKIEGVLLKVNWSKQSSEGDSNREKIAKCPPGMEKITRSLIDPVTKKRVFMPRPPGIDEPEPPGQEGDVLSYPSMNPKNYAASLASTKQ